MIVIGLDPGTEQSAVVAFDGRSVTHKILAANADVLGWLHRCDASLTLAYEMVASYGMPVGREVFETVLWTGRMIERFPGEHVAIYRRDVKSHLCGSMRAKDPNVRQALLDRFGPGRQAAIGTKAAPGPLYGVKTHLWSALAVAVTCYDLSR